MKNLKSTFAVVHQVLLIVVIGCSPHTEKNKDKFEIASPDYASLAAKALTSFTQLDFDAWASMLSDDIEYYFPNGDAGTRTKLVGKKAVLEWWNNWKKTSGIQSMTYKDHVDLPVNVKDTLAYSGLTGIMVVSYFSNELVYNGKPVNLRMNFVAHFNSKNLIDRYYTYYDRTKIVEAMKENILEEKKK